MNDLEDKGSFELDGASTRLVLLDDTPVMDEMTESHMELSMNHTLPESSRANKRKSTHQAYEDEYGFTKLKYLKRNSHELEKLPSPTSSSEVDLVEGGSYYISVMPSGGENGIIDDHFGKDSSSAEQVKQIFANSDDENNSEKMLVLDKDDLTLCSIKESMKDERRLRISVSVPVSIPVSKDVTMAVSALPSGTLLSQEYMEQDPIDHAYHRANEGGVTLADPVRTTWVTTKADKTQLKNNGHTWKTGKWTRDEINLLKSNIDKYCAGHNIKDAQQIIFHATKEERKNFYPTIAEGLNRPVFAVYRRVKRMYDSQNYRGKYSEEEVKQLKHLHAKHGRDWGIIGQQMGRSSDSVKDRCRLFKDTERVTGKWTAREEEKLAESVYLVTGKEPGTPITGEVTWSSVAHLVGTRTEKQCRAKWLNYLNWKLCNGDDWMKTDDKLLIERIKDMGILSEEEIEWRKLSDGWASSRSPQWLRNKWWNLKKLYHAENPDVSSITLSELLQELHRIISKQIMQSWERGDHRKFVNQEEVTTLYSFPEKKRRAEVETSNKILKRGVRKSNHSGNLRKTHPKAPDDVYVTRANNVLDDGVIIGKVHQATSKGSQIQAQYNDRKLINAFSLPRKQKVNTESKSQAIKLAEEFILSDDKKKVEFYTNEQDNDLPLNPASSSGVFLLQNPESNNQLVLFLSEDVTSNMNFTLSLVNRAKVEGESEDPNLAEQDEMGRAHHHHDNDIVSPTSHHMDMTSSHADVITTSDVLVYQETVNDEDVKNPVLSSAIHEVVTEGGHDNDEDDCFMRTSSPLQGTLLEGTDLASTTIRMDDPH